MPSPLRIAVFECDGPFGELMKRYSYGGKEYGICGMLFKRLLDAGASKLEVESGLYKRPNIVISSYDVVNKQEYPEVEKIDAVFVSGSRYDSFAPGDNNWILNLVTFIKTLLQTQSRVKVIGVCFGHQVIGRAYGVMPIRNPLGWEISVTPITLTERGKRVFGRDSLKLHQMHRDIIPHYPLSDSVSVEPLGSSTHCAVQFIYIQNRVLSLQGHPEYDCGLATQILDRRRGVAIDEAMYREGMDRVGDAHDGGVVGVGFLRFLMED